MTRDKLLTQLHGLQLPNQPPWWDMAPGWYGVLGILGLIALAGLYKGVRTWQHKRQVQRLLGQAQTLYDQYQDNGHKYAEAVSLLIKRILIQYHGRQYAYLHSRDWIATLQQFYNDPHLEQLVEASYRYNSSLTPNTIKPAIDILIKQIMKKRHRKRPARQNRKSGTSCARSTGISAGPK